KSIKWLGSMLFAAALASPGASAVAQEFRLLSGWVQNFAYNPYLLDPFVEGIEKASDGKMKISVYGPETVPPFEQLEPVGSGAFDFLFTAGAYHFGTPPIMTVAEAITTTPEELHSSGLFDEFDRHYQKFGLKLIAA